MFTRKEKQKGEEIVKKTETLRRQVEQYRQMAIEAGISPPVAEDMFSTYIKMGGITTNKITPSIFETMEDPDTLGRFEVRKVANGFVLRYAASNGNKWTEWIATDVEELAATFVKIMVEAKLDKS